MVKKEELDDDDQNYIKGLFPDEKVNKQLLALEKKEKIILNKAKENKMQDFVNYLTDKVGYEKESTGSGDDDTNPLKNKEGSPSLPTLQVVGGLCFVCILVVVLSFLKNKRQQVEDRR
ncbi:MAG: hypothetical protein AAF335_00050 [Bacteroidota bacterium]